MGGHLDKLSGQKYLENEVNLMIKEGNINDLKGLTKDSNFVNFVFVDGTTLLHVAALHHRKECLRFLLRKRLVPINSRDHSDETALNTALEQTDDLECADILITAGIDIHLKNKWLRTPLLKAVINQDERAVLFLLNKGCNPNTEDCMGCTPLNQSVFYHLHRSFKCLLQHSVDIDYVNKNDLSALYFACKSLNKIAVSKLLKLGARVSLDLIQKILLFFDNELTQPQRAHKAPFMESILLSVISALGQTIPLNVFFKLLRHSTALNVSKSLFVCTERRQPWKQKVDSLELYRKNKLNWLAAGNCDCVPSLMDISRLLVRERIAASRGNVITGCSLLNIPPGLKSVILLHDI
ncbi:ankyrin repeat domain-containing protein 7 [Patella vulgata]|uniref:ankyrin repeat domain-containing protein 7 n=1 Tax=Patella vulgata TaxID=6465 RepID=UPI0021808A80|nr:ankyrin repeat domain-containing protein 7 [Patella vulgata]XP_050411816.1 ankyrin repeat domain-containing protein 7 [Patella vulgata]